MTPSLNTDTNKFAQFNHKNTQKNQEIFLINIKSYACLYSIETS